MDSSSIHNYNVNRVSPNKDASIQLTAVFRITNIPDGLTVFFMKPTEINCCI